MKDYRERKLNRKEKLKLLVILATGMLCVGIIFYHSAVPVLLTPLLFTKASGIYASLLGRKERKNLREQFKDLLYSMSSSFATGRHMREALLEGERELGKIYPEKSEIVESVRYMNGKINAGNVPDIEVLSEFAEKSGLEDVESFVQVYRSCRETGGDVIGAMNKCARVISEKIMIEGEIELMVSQKKVEGLVITVMPPVIIIFLHLVSPGYLNVLYETLLGRVIMTLALVSMVFAYFMIDRITRVEV